MSSSIEESENAKATLRDWAQQQQLSLVTLSDDGTMTLTGPSATIPGHVVLTISSSDNTTIKQCQYTAASIFLQIRDPHQGLLPYRSVCKKHKVQDPVKALDKPMMLSYFLGWEEEPEGEGAGAGVGAAGEPASQPLLEGGLSQLSQPTTSVMAPQGEDTQMETTEAVETTATTTTTDMEVDAPAEGAEASQESASSPTKKPSSRHKDPHHHKDRHGKDSKDRHHRSHSDKENKEKHRSSSKRPHHASDASPSKRHKSSSTTPSSKSSSKPMTNEQLFSNLNVVVDKRLQYPKDESSSSAQQQDEALEALAIHQALSAEGFQVTPEILALHQETSQWIASHEIPVGNSASILRATAGRDLKRVLELFVEATTGSATSPGGSGKHKSPPSKSSKSSIPSPLPPPAAPPGTKPINKFLLGKKPIIIVPKAMSAPISMINAHEFFANAKFVPRDVMLKQQAASGQRRGPPLNTFSRRVSPRWLTVTSKALSNAPIVPNNAATGMLEFEIMDNPTSKLGVEHVRDWQRIVAVVSLGQPWQFKDWPGPYGQAVSLFGEHCYGCYIGLEGDSIPPDLAKWNVKKSKLSRDKRSLDSVTHANFWNELEEWMAIHKPELLPQTPTNH